jgi:hypothetical protein
MQPSQRIELPFLYPKGESMNGTNLVLIIALFALVAVGAFVVFRRRARVDIKGPFGTGLNLSGSNDPAPIQPGVRVADAASRRGGLTAADSTGRGAEVQRVDVDKDINVSSSPPPEKADPND